MKSAIEAMAGFTLLEVMLALGVLSFAGLMVYEHNANLLFQQNTLEEKALANWLAQNELNRYRIGKAVDPESPLSGAYEGTGGIETFGGRQWRIEVDRRSTDPGSVRSHTVEVFLNDRDGTDPIERITTFEWNE